MTWTYSGDPSASDRDQVRFLIGDTDSTDKQLQDEEIAYLLAQYPDARQAAAQAAWAVAAKYARLASSHSVGDTAYAYGSRQQYYESLAAQLNSRSLQSARPYCGGISLSDKARVEGDADRNAGPFKDGQMDNKG